MTTTSDSNNSSKEQQARAFAIEAHGEQRYGEHPYVVHLEAVRAVLRDFGHADESDLAIAAWLHDVIEDTKIDRERIEAEFGTSVAGLVWAVTGVGANRKERTQAAYAKMQALPEAITLKLADRIANCEASAKNNPKLLGMYRAEMQSFSAALDSHGADGENAKKNEAMWSRLRAALE